MRKRTKEVEVEIVFNCTKEMDRKIYRDKTTGVYTIYLIEPEYMVDRERTIEIVRKFARKYN